MDNSVVAFVLFVGLLSALAMVPKFIRWLQGRHSSLNPAQDVRVVSAVAVGAQHKVVVVSLGSGAHETRLVLGVSPQAINCLHTFASPNVTAPGHGGPR